MPKSLRYYMFRHYLICFRRNALYYSLAFLMLYLVSDYVAQIRPLTPGTLFQTCQRDATALLTRLPYVETPGRPAPSARRSPSAPAEHREEGNRAPSLIDVKLNSPYGQTPQFIKEHYGNQK